MYRQVWKLIPNKVRAEGGRELDKFRGVPDPHDTPNGAEAWIGSVTRANGATKEHPNLGCAEVELPNGQRRYLFEVIQEAPEQVLGSEHVERYGNGLGILVKCLDAKRQFLLQCHPSRETAQAIWNSEFGKTECWHVLSVRNDEKEAPYIFLGFKPNVTKEAFEAAYRNGDLEAIERMCHKFAVQPGETYYIPPGMPHALGVGCFVIEVQEPTDLTAVPIPQGALIQFRKESNPLGVFIPIDDELYESQMLSAFDYRGLSFDEMISRTKSINQVIRNGEWGDERMLIGPEQTPYFFCTMLDVKGSVQMKPTGKICIAIVTDGEGEIFFPGGRLQVKRGSELFIPYGADDVKVQGELTLVMCHPAGAEIL